MRSSGRPRRSPSLRCACERLADLGEQLVAHHVVAEIDRVGEAFGIGAAVALDDDAVEAEEDAAVGLARIHLVAERAEGAARQTGSRAWPRRCGSSRAEILAIWRAVPSAALSAMLPANPSVTTTSTVPLPMSSPSTKPEYSNCGHRPSRSIRPASRTSSRPLTSSTPILSSPTVGRSRPNRHARHGAAHGGKIDEVLRHRRRSRRRDRARSTRPSASATSRRWPDGRSRPWS